jgi:hypothetical protein
MTVSAATILTLALLSSSARSVRAGTTTFSNGFEHWQFSGATQIEPSGGNPGAYAAFQALGLDSAFGFNVFNNSNPEFIGNVYLSPVTISVDVRTTSIITEGNEVPRDLFVELRDTTAGNGGVPYSSVFYDLGVMTSTVPGWVHYSVTITDPNSATLPPGWIGFGATDADHMPILPPGTTFADVLHNVDVINFTSFKPGFAFTDTGFDLSFDNLGVNAVPEPSSLVMLGIAAMCLAGYACRKASAF